MKASSATSIGAVVLSTGEATVGRALASLRRQSLELQELIQLQGVEPLHEAMREATRRVSTPFFLQVDADMVLDPDCTATLSACAAENVGLVVGLLRDPLLGRIEAIKLFRTECLRQVPFPAGLGPGPTFADSIAELGWATVYALIQRPGPIGGVHTVGEHRPDYSNPAYTYGKFVVEGRRWRQRRNPWAVQDWLRRLRESPEPAARVAELALAHGLFREGNARLDPHGAPDEFPRLAAFLDEQPSAPDRFRVPLPRPGLSPRATFRRWYRLGNAIRGSGRPDRLERTLQRLHAWRHPWDWLMRVAVCQGIHTASYDAATCETDWSRVQPLTGPLSWPNLLDQLSRRVGLSRR